MDLRRTVPPLYTKDIDLSNNKFELAAYCKFLNGSLIKSKLWDKVKYSVRRYIEDNPTFFKLVYYSKRVILERKTKCH